MYVVKRNGSHEKVMYDKITARNLELAAGLDVDTTALSKEVIAGLHSGITTDKIDELSCECALSLSPYEPDYSTLAVRIAVNNLHKNTPDTFSECMDLLYTNKCPRGKPKPLYTDLIYQFAKAHIAKINDNIDHERDYNFTYFGINTLRQQGYLRKRDDRVVERPQYMFMRVALGIHGPYVDQRTGEIIPGDIDKVLESYQLYSLFKLTQATPTIFHASEPNANLSSCFLLECEDSIEGWSECWKDSAFISKAAGGLSLDLTFVREAGAFIGGTGGRSLGIIPLCVIFNNIARAVNQDGKRKGAFSLSLQPWHPDFPEFLEIRKKTGDQNHRAHDIFPALFIPDLYFKRAQIQDSVWSMFSPLDCPELITLYGDEWEARYLELEAAGKYVRQMPMAQLWQTNMQSEMENGLPYMISKDNVNRKSNQKNLGPILSTNLCCEIMEWKNSQSIASCNLSSLGLPAFMIKNSVNTWGGLKFDFQGLGRDTRVQVRNLDRVIEVNRAPAERAKNNNLDYRPIGCGIQGLDDVFKLSRFSWESPQAVIMNKLIFEYIYHHALTESCRLATIHGPHKGFQGSPASQGILSYDMWGVTPLTMTDEYLEDYGASKLDWTALKERIKLHGLRNSLLISPMPTASTAQIMGNTESFQVAMSLVYLRKTLSNEYPVVSTHLYSELKRFGMWTKAFVDALIKDNGSIQAMLHIPEDIRIRYKTVWETSQRHLGEMAADRGAFIDQSQSFNVFMARPSVSKLSSMYIHFWKLGNKTLSYYLHSQPAINAPKFSLDTETTDPKVKTKTELPVKMIGGGGMAVCDDGSCCTA